jgi:putative ABC transport system permease protein
MKHSRLSLTLRTIRLGIRNVRAHSMRSILTVLGIVFGVCSVIIMLAIGEGASQDAQEQIKRLGSQNIIIRSVKPVISGDAQDSNSWLIKYGLTYLDAERLAETLPAVEVIIPVKGRPIDLWCENRRVQVEMLATVPWFTRSRQLEILPGGRFISGLDMAQRENVCVIGQSTARELFLYEEALGRTVRIGKDTYRIIGIIRDAAVNSVGVAGELGSQTASCFIPLTTARTRDGDKFIHRGSGGTRAEELQLSELILTVDELESIVPTASQARKLLEEHHPRGDFEIIIPQRLIEEAKRTQRRWSMMLGSVAAISLLVGGIGIMNIMLASVSERTREIGVRRALGARRRDILSQFLVETMILSIGGGILGIILGAGIPPLITWKWGFNTVLTPEPFLLSFFVSAVVGVVFGLYPARRAALMDPIEALRHE